MLELLMSPEAVVQAAHTQVQSEQETAAASVLYYELLQEIVDAVLHLALPLAGTYSVHCGDSAQQRTCRGAPSNLAFGAFVA